MPPTSALYSTDQSSKKNKTWHDGTVEHVDGCLVVRDDSGGVLLRQHTPCSTVAGKLEFSVGRFSLRLDEVLPVVDVHTATTTTSSVKRKGPLKFAIRYRNTTSPDQPFRDGTAEYDGKSLVVFKDVNLKMFHKKICPGIAEGEAILCGPFLIEVIEADVDHQDNSKNIYTRKTLVCKAASAAAHSESPPPDPPLPNQMDTETTNTVFKCIFTEDKQKRQKRWIDAVLRVGTDGLAVIESGESGEVVLRRHFKGVDVLREGFEFDGGKYRFQITESPVSIEPPQPPITTTRKRLMTVSEIRARKEDLLSPPSDTIGTATAEIENFTAEIENFFDKHHSNTVAFKKAKTDSMFDMFDD